MSIPNDIQIATYAITECGGSSFESIDEREGIRKGARWMRTFLTKEPYASAPELLEALKLALNELGGNDPNDLAYESEIMGTIRQAIAKAEGIV